MKSLTSKCVVVLLVAVMILAFSAFSHADDNPLNLACPSGSAQVGVLYNSQLVVTGGAPPYTFLVVQNSYTVPLPPGLTLNSSTGAITGTPTTAGTYYPIEFEVYDATNQRFAYCSMMIAVAPPVTASCVAITAVQGVPITPVTMQASGGVGGPYHFTAMGLPQGLGIADNGTISGTPTQSGTFPYTVTITDSAGNQGTVSCSVTVAPPVSATCLVINATQGSLVSTGPMTGSGGTGGPYTFSSSDLPAGLNMAADGSISGTPTVSGTFSYHVTVTDKDGHTGTIACSVTINGAPSATCLVINATQGSPVSTGPMTGSGGTGGPYTFSSNDLPAGLNMAADGSISGTPTVSGTFSYHVTVTDKDGHTGTIACSVTINGAPSATCLVINATQGSLVSTGPMTGSGGTGGPYTFSSSDLPAGLNMAADGSISGTPTVSGTFSYHVTVKDKDGHSGTIACSVTINGAPSATCLVINATQGSLVSTGPMTGSGGTGGPYTFSSSDLPAGLNMAADGSISGTPTVSGTFTYHVTVTDKDGHTGTIACSVTINGTPSATCLVINATQGSLVSTGPMTGSGGTGGPYTFSSGDLPAGLNMAADGSISGTPTVSGTFTYHVTVTDKDGHTGTITCSVTINGAPSATCLVINATQGSLVSTGPMTGSGGTGGPYTFSSSDLPAGLNMAADGSISGTPTVSGTFTYHVTVKDKDGHTGTITCSVTINGAPSATCLVINATQGSLVSTGPMTGSGGTGGPYTFSSSDLPAGLNMAADGSISGTPTVSGTFTYHVTVKDKDGHTGTIACSVTINGAPSTTCLVINNAVQGSLLSTGPMTGSGGTGGPYTFSSSDLPAGLNMAANGSISGTPTVSGTLVYHVTVTDKDGHTGTVMCSVTINGAPSATCLVINATQGSLVSTGPMTGSGGTGGPYTFSSGDLPAGLNMAANGSISGTPTVSGTFTYHVTVTDKDGHTGTITCSVTINGAPSATCLVINATRGSLVSTGPMTGSGGTGGPYTFSSSDLPAGLNMAVDGSISGTPTVSGTFTYHVTVKDKDGHTGTIACSVTIASPSLGLTCAASTGQVGLAYSSSLVATGGAGSYTYSIVSGLLPPGLTLNKSTGVISGTPSSEGTFSFTTQAMDANGNKVTVNCTITITTCGTTLTAITNSVNEGSGMQSQIVWFNSHLTKLSGTIPNSDFKLYITGGSITFGPVQLPVPDAVITFSSTASCSKTTFNTTLNRWETTIPLSWASQADEIFAAGIAYQIPAGFPQQVKNATWSADISSNAAGVVATWQFGVSNWLTQNKGSVFPNLSLSPFVPDYNGMQVMAAHNTPTCYGQSGDQAGAPEFSSRGNLLTGGGCGGGGSNWTGSWSSTPAGVNVCKPGMLLSCPTNKATQYLTYGSAFGGGGGTSPYTFSMASGSLPPGLNMDSSSGAVTGTPTTDGTFLFTGQVTDSSSPQQTVTASCGITVSTASGCYTTYTQGGWGSAPHGGNPGALLQQYFSTVYPGGSVKIGGVSTGGYILTFTGQPGVQNFLPEGGTPGVLTKSATNPTSSSAGVFAGQVLALELNIDFSNAGINRPGLGYLVVNGGKLNGYTYQQVLDLANAVLGGKTSALPSGMTVSNLNDIVDSLNNSYDH